MSSNADIHAFAVKWFDVFRNTKTVIEDIGTLARFGSAIFLNEDISRIGQIPVKIFSLL